MSNQIITYAAALSRGLVAAMEEDDSIFVTGIAVDYPSGMFGTTIEALKKFGPERVFDAPAMENAMTGIAIGAAAMGKRPVIIHPRADFLFLALDQLINLGAKWSYMFGGNAGRVPIVIRAVIGKGWGQGGTHSQSLHSIISHFPGIHVSLPSDSESAMNLTYTALKNNTPTVIFEHRSLFDFESYVPERPQELEIGKAKVLRNGNDITIIATSFMTRECLKAADTLSTYNISAEVIDLQWVRPLDENTILKSLKKTGRLIATDVTWELNGTASEVCALVAEQAFDYLKSPVRRICQANSPAPVSQPLERSFYPTANTIVKAAGNIFGVQNIGEISSAVPGDQFKGPY